MIKIVRESRPCLECEVAKSGGEYKRTVIQRNNELYRVVVP